MLKGAKLTDLVVGVSFGVALLVGVFWLLGPILASITTLYLLYEFYSLVNKEGADTLSESIVRYSKRPLVPLLFGLFTGIGLMLLASGDLMLLRVFLVIYFTALLQGHFFWQFQQAYDAAPKNS